MTNEDRRTLRTRAALRAAFVAQVLERGYAGVRVEHIAAAADVGRATFYTHFRDKEALYDHVVEVVLGELRERITPADWEGVGFTGRPVAELFRHASEQPEVYRLILRGEGDGRGLRALVDAWTTTAYDVFAERAETQRIRPRVDLRVVARAWVGEQAAVLLWWLESPAPRPGTEQVVETLVELSRHGRYWATGFDPVST
ncbi:TetR/AcrR family transcriptional regulator [Nocardiopsis halotolerans]|uniref:TetR/AcrR family transcriptional regulator n=1 Tax=Nocardiopsis halotolerans TaxID=124252 RepID=UPI000346F918|nr:TetR/AcrR family transcriptional regulator [Nocardiopsis halotolerans]